MVKVLVEEITRSKVLTRAERLANGNVALTFVNGRTKEFRNVTDNKFNALLTAPSIGRFFNFTIRDNPNHQVV